MDEETFTGPYLRLKTHVKHSVRLIQHYVSGPAQVGDST